MTIKGEDAKLDSKDSGEDAAIPNENIGSAPTSSTAWARRVPKFRDRPSGNYFVFLINCSGAEFCFRRSFPARAFR
jgi:hypothetical protein